MSPVPNQAEGVAGSRPETLAAPVREPLAIGGPATFSSPDLANGPIRLDDAARDVLRSEVSMSIDPTSTTPARFTSQSSLPVTQAIPAGVPLPAPGDPEPRPGLAIPSAGPPQLAAVGVPPASELAQLVPEPVAIKEEQGRGRSTISAPATTLLAPAALRREAVREQVKPDLPARPRGDSSTQPIPLARAMPGGTVVPGPSSQPLADLAAPLSGRNLSEVPRFYRSRLDANRTVLAQRSGASIASEQAVERL